MPLQFCPLHVFRRLPRLLPGLLVSLGLAALLPAAIQTVPEEIRFNRDVRPILSNTCFKCHGADEAANEAGLRLDLAELAYAERATEGGGSYRPIVPGNPAESEIWKRISSADPVMVMPPPDNLHQLSERDKQVLFRWIKQGAEYEAHWAYVAPVKGDLPVVDRPDWVSNPIDAFILRRLEASGISPSEPADRNSLIRRLTLDLTGLPPAPEAVEAFVTDDRPDAYERVVDRLLSSPHYGERMAVPWLDSVRYADTVGFHGDQGQNIFPYRDYVINAFNRNKPYDAFVVEQIAGDLLPEPSTEQLVATGFNRLNMMSREGGAQPKEYLAKYNADRVRAVSTVFMGSTLACAECHDHKYDPFTAKDFYAMAAFFADVKQWGVYSDYNYTPNPELKGWTNDHPFPPEIEVKSPYLVDRKARLEAEWAAFLQEQAREVEADPEQREAVGLWALALSQFMEAHPSGWEVLVPGDAVSTKQAHEILIREDGSVSIQGAEMGKEVWNRDTFTLHFSPEFRNIGTFRLEFIPDPSQGDSITRNPDGYFDTELKWFIQGPGEDARRRIEIANGEPGGLTRNYSNGRPAPYLANRLQSHPSLEHTGFFMHYHPQRRVDLAPGESLVLELRSRDIASVRVSTTPLAMVSPDSQILDVLSGPLFQTYVKTGMPLDDALNQRRHYFQREILLCRDGWWPTMVTESVDPMEIRLLPRGDWQDDSGPVVKPAVPEFLAGTPIPSAGKAEGKPLTRLDLAEWMVDRENPLTARTFVNRLWKQCFGVGLSAVTDDLGNQGEWPSHPELLDWMAVDFMESGWDVKAMVKQIVMSSTYRQSARGRPELEDIDPDNRLLARQNARRLEAEFVRDNALALSGLLEPSLGGPSVRPYQPEGHYEHLNFPIRKYQADQDERQYRRGVYMHWQRTFLHPMLANFDAPGREECTADRTESNTPQQALTLMNDPTFVEAARVYAQNSLLADAALDPEERVRALFFRTVSREPNPGELDTLVRFFQDRAQHYAANAAEAEAFASTGNHERPDHLDPVELASWTAVTRVLLNLNETIVRY